MKYFDFDIKAAIIKNNELYDIMKHVCGDFIKQIYATRINFENYDYLNILSFPKLFSIYNMSNFTYVNENIIIIVNLPDYFFRIKGCNKKDFEICKPIYEFNDPEIFSKFVRNKLILL